MNSVFIHLIQSLSNNWWKNKTTNKIVHFILKVKKQKLKSRRAEEPGGGTRPMRGQNRRGQWRTANQAELQQRDWQGDKETSYSPGVFFRQSFNRCTIRIELCGQYCLFSQCLILIKHLQQIKEKTNRVCIRIQPVVWHIRWATGRLETSVSIIILYRRRYIMILMLNTIYLYV